MSSLDAVLSGAVPSVNGDDGYTTPIRTGENNEDATSAISCAAIMLRDWNTCLHLLNVTEML